MPLYNSATTAAALGVSHKWLDNLLSHNKIAGVSSERQGVARRLSLSAIELVAIVNELSSSLGAPSASALKIARQMMQKPGFSYRVSPSIALTLDPLVLNRDLAERLAHAVEITPHRSRGRPRATPT